MGFFGGKKAPAQKKIDQQLNKTEGILIKEAAQLEKEVRALITEDVRELRLAQAAWQAVEKFIKDLKEIKDQLKIAEGQSNKAVGQFALRNVLNLLMTAGNDLGQVEKAVKMAVRLDKLEVKTSAYVLDALKDAHKALIKEHTRVEEAHKQKGW